MLVAGIGEWFRPFISLSPAKLLIIFRLGLKMWADPETCLTVPSGGLPEGRPVSVFCFAPPYVVSHRLIRVWSLSEPQVIDFRCVMSPSLSRLASSLITSFAYSHDAITRLSLGSVRDLQRVTSWLCYGQKKNPDSKESCSSIIQRAVMLEKNISFMGIGADREAEEAWVCEASCDDTCLTAGQ